MEIKLSNILNGEVFFDRPSVCRDFKKEVTILGDEIVIIYNNLRLNFSENIYLVSKVAKKFFHNASFVINEYIKHNIKVNVIFIGETIDFSQDELSKYNLMKEFIDFVRENKGKANIHFYFDMKIYNNLGYHYKYEEKKAKTIVVKELFEKKNNKKIELEDFKKENYFTLALGENNFKTLIFNSNSFFLISNILKAKVGFFKNNNKLTLKFHSKFYELKDSNINLSNLTDIETLKNKNSYKYYILGKNNKMYEFGCKYIPEVQFIDEAFLDTIKRTSYILYILQTNKIFSVKERLKWEYYSVIIKNKINVDIFKRIGEKLDKVIIKDYNKDLLTNIENRIKELNLDKFKYNIKKIMSEFKKYYD